MDIIVDESEEVEAARNWSKFYYHLYRHVSWLPRRVNSWSFDGDAQWVRRVSFDLDLSQFERYANMMSVDLNDNDDAVLVPLFDVDKRLQFISFDLENAEGRSLQLVPRSSSAVICLNILEGGILAESCGGDGNLPPLDEKPFLWEFLRQWFSLERIPTDADGSYLSYGGLEDESGFLGTIYSAMNTFQESLASAGVQDSQVHEDFELYYKQSTVFRFFLRLYSFK